MISVVLLQSITVLFCYHFPCSWFVPLQGEIALNFFLPLSCLLFPAGFDPWNESSKALADLIEKESLNMAQPPRMQSRHTQAGIGNHYSTDRVPPSAGTGTRGMPPGFQPNHISSFQTNPSESCHKYLPHCFCPLLWYIRLCLLFFFA